MIAIELIGYIAGLTVALSLTPQVIKAWKTKSTKDISIGWTVIYAIGVTLWVIYGIGIRSFPVMITMSIEGALAFSVLFMKIRYG